VNLAGFQTVCDEGWRRANGTPLVEALAARRRRSRPVGRAGGDQV